MLQTWRWFGPDDPVSLENAAQAGAAGVVTALHHMNRGEVWSEDEVLKRRAEIQRAGLVWSVVESIGVGEEIKTRSGGFRQKIENYKQSIRNAARAGVKTFCYNFMAITDWTRTNVNWPLANGGTALRFDAVDCAAYDLFILARDGAEADYAPERIALAHARFNAMTPGREGQARAYPDRLAAGARLRLRPAKLQAGARALQGNERRRPARQSDRVRARHCSRGRGGGRAPRHPSRRSGFPDLRPAAGSVYCRRRAQAHCGRAVSRLRDHALRRLVRLQPRERSRRDGAGIRITRPFRPSAQRQARGGRFVF